MSTYLSEKFPDFRQHPQATIRGVFKQLAKEKGWEPKSAKYKSERDAYLLSEYEQHLGVFNQPDNLSGLQNLCRQLGLEQIPDSIKKCKKALKKQIFVNIHDLLDHFRHHGTAHGVRHFSTLAELAKYTRKTGKYFPLGEAKADSLLRALLRHIRYR